jgi:hypothetical protein
MWRQPSRLSSRAKRGSVCKFDPFESSIPIQKKKRDVASNVSTMESLLRSTPAEHWEEQPSPPPPRFR